MSEIEENNHEKQQLDPEQSIQEAAKKLDVDVDVLREITPQEVEYLLDHCPFLQIVNPEISLEESEVQFVEAISGWTIHDYGDAMSSSPGRLIFGGGYFIVGDDDDEGGGGDIINPGKGTLIKQAFDTAIHMVEIAVQHGWKGIQIVDGHPVMARAAWIKADQLGMTVDGYEPNAYDERVRHHVELSENEIEVLKQKIRPKL